MQGGSYIVDPKSGKLKLVERTQPHADSPRARDADGRALDDQGRAPQSPAPAATTESHGADRGGKTK